MESIIFIIAFVVLFYGFFSKKLEYFNISGPMVFLLYGMLLSPLGLDFLEVDLNSDALKITAEIALITVLFTDSSTLDLKSFKKEWKISARLLFIGLPLTILLSTYIATLFFADESLLYLLLMALILAPTDAALGQAVVSDKLVPHKIRSSINVESGLNDGIVFPLLITVILLIVSNKELGSDSGWIVYLLKQMSIGFIVGAVSGYLGAKGLNSALKKSWIKEVYSTLFPVSLAILIFYIAEYLGGNGFIAVYIAGAIFGNFIESVDANAKNFLESEGEVLLLVSFLVFGLTFVPATIEFWSMNVIIYSLLSLTLFRMLPVALSLIALELSWFSRLFIGWFGPRGIASILYVMTVADSIESIKNHNTIFSVITLTILLSIVLHGLSAKPLVNLYEKTFKL